VVARITEAPADPAAVAAGCGVTRQGAEALLSALAGLDLLELGEDGCYRPASSGLAELAQLLRPWASLGPALRGEGRPADAATIAGAESLYPRLVSQLGAFFRPSAVHGAGLLAQSGMRVLDVGAGAAPSTSRSTRTSVTSLTRRRTSGPRDASPVRCGQAPGSRSSTSSPTSAAMGRGRVVLYALGLMLRTGSGRIYPYSTFRRWLDEGGFEDARRHNLPGPFPCTLITGKRR
jgi:hypothetical protein